MSIKPTVALKGVNRVNRLDDIMRRFDKLEVYVGVPQEKTERQEVEHAGGKAKVKAQKADITNAELLYIHTNGSELRGIPARPVLEPAILDDKDNIARELKAAGEAVFQNNRTAAIQGLRRAGAEGQNAARGWFTNPRNGWAPNAPETIAAKGSDRPLIDTSQLRNAIIYVIAENE